jgi:hypothetical protein
MAEFRFAYTLPARDEEQLHQELFSLFPGKFQGVCGSGPVVQAVFSGDLTSSEKTSLDSAVLGHVPNTQLQGQRLQTAAKALFDRPDLVARLVRALALVVLDEINRLRGSPTTTFPPISPTAMRSAILAKLDLDNTV